MASRAEPDNRGLLPALVGDGRPLIFVSALALLASGAFALFLSATGQFLPHDIEFLGMPAADLCAVNGCRIVHFMFHDRVSFGGVLVSVAIFYLWLAAFPLARGEPWAWWTLAVSGAMGFASFLAYLGYGYLDTWHGAATLILLPCFAGGLAMTHRNLRGNRSIRSLASPATPVRLRTAGDYGRACLYGSAFGLVAGGLTIMTVGMTSVFVPQDLTFMGLSADELRAINPRLIPLIAHDRAGFGGGVACCGVLVFLCAWCAPPSRALWQALLAAGGVGFGCAIGVHPAVGYVDALHLAPAVLGALLYLAGLLLVMPEMLNGGRAERAADSAAAPAIRYTSRASS